MRYRALRRFFLPAVLSAPLTVVPLPGAGQGGERPDLPEDVARGLADDLVGRLRDHTEIHGQRLALQPLDPGAFVDLDERGRQRLYGLLAGSLGAEIRGSYEWVNPSRFKNISRLLEDRGESDWHGRFMDIVREAQGQIIISCEASPSRRGRFELECSSDSVSPAQNRGTARAQFRTDWLKGPVDPDWALASIAEAVVKHMQGVGSLRSVSIVDSESGGETALSTHFAELLEDEVNEKKRDWRGPRPVGGQAGGVGYRATGKVDRYSDRLDLRVELYSSDGHAPETTFRETMHWTPRLEELADWKDDACGTDADLGQRRLADGRTLADWVLVAGVRLDSGDHLNLMVEAKSHLADHCGWDAVAGIMDAAVAGLAEELGAAIERNARSGLERLARVEASAGRHLPLLRLRAHAHKRLGERREEERAYSEWLDAAPPDNPERLEVLMAQDRVRAGIAAEDGEVALGLDGRRRSLVRRGLTSFGFAGGVGTAPLGAPFRVALRSWQASTGNAETGHLTAGEAEALIAEGRAVEEREKDDAAFGRARAADTAEAYARYLADFPNGRHVAAARRLFAVASAREAAERARQAAVAGEQLLALGAEERVLVERGLASWRSGGGREDGKLDDAFRAMLRAWQESRGQPVTGYLTGEQSEELIAFGRAEAAVREAERVRRVRERQAEARRAAERRADDVAFADAKRLHTPASYRAYLERGGRHEAEARALLAEVKWPAGKKFRECPECPELVVVPAGSFDMGSPPDEVERRDDEGPVHWVTISEPFAVGVYEVTRGEWSRFVSETGYASVGSCWTNESGEWKDRTGRGWRDPGFDQGAGHPVVCVSWEDAQEFVRWLSVETGEEYRLLSESEWEYVARAGTTGPFHYGSTISAEQANYDGNYTYGGGRPGRYREETVSVGELPSNEFGLHDVHGNVWEWVEDCWHDSYRGAPSDGRAWTSGGDCGQRVLRGGSWGRACVPRIAAGAPPGPGRSSRDIGFRAGLSLAPLPSPRAGVQGAELPGRFSVPLGFLIACNPQAGPAGLPRPRSSWERGHPCPRRCS